MRKPSATVYTLVVPDAHRHGPGHRSHLSPDGGKTTLCKVENNAHGLVKLFPNEVEPSSDVRLLKKRADQVSCRSLCSNCERRALPHREGHNG